MTVSDNDEKGDYEADENDEDGEDGEDEEDVCNADEGELAPRALSCHLQRPNEPPAQGSLPLPPLF